MASVKVVALSDSNESRVTGGPGTDDPERITYYHQSLGSLVCRAYDIRPYQLVGLPPSIRGRYDVVAKIPPGSTREQLSFMLQNLLSERFGLAVHWEAKDLSIYELVVAQGGPKLKKATLLPFDTPPSTPAGGGPTKMARDSAGETELPYGVPGIMVFGLGVNRRRASVRSETIATFARALEGFQAYIDRPVIDGTGLTGTYDFNLDFAPAIRTDAGSGVADASEPAVGPASLLDAASDPGFPNLFVALESQLGLRLEPRKGQVRLLVVDYVNSKPTEN